MATILKLAQRKFFNRSKKETLSSGAHSVNHRYHCSNKILMSGSLMYKSSITLWNLNTNNDFRFPLPPPPLSSKLAMRSFSPYLQ